MISKKKNSNQKKQYPNKLLFLMPVVIVLVLLGFFMTRKNIVENDDTFVETTSTDMFDFEANYADKKSVVVYFSATGNTKNAAEKIAEIMDADMIEIKAKEAYTEHDLTSYDDMNTRPRLELAFDPFNPDDNEEEDEENVKVVKKLPEIEKVDVKKYNLIFVGYPIWFGDAPRVIYSFIEKNNLDKKVVIPFCTSDNSDISPSDNNLAEYAYSLYDNVDFMSGMRITKDMTSDSIKEWIKVLGPDIS